MIIVESILPNGYRLTELGPLPEEWRVVRLRGRFGAEVTWAFRWAERSKYYEDSDRDTRG